ncbi:hypothetical protein AHAS_Ahas03G0024100 [Arachis hypogaea]
MDEKWKLSSSKKETGSSSSNNSSNTNKSLFSRSCSTRGSSSSNSPLLRRSSSTSKCNSNNLNNLHRSFSQKNNSNSNSNNPSIGRKCTKIAKEQKARFYIMRRVLWGIESAEHVAEIGNGRLGFKSGSFFLL